MIPNFDDNGYLPPGIHMATLAEIAERFGQGDDQRRAGMDSIRWLVDIARRAGVERIIVNGSFVTDRFEPNDVDCVLLAGPSYAADQSAREELKQGLPFLELHVVEDVEFAEFVQDIYGTDRLKNPKGMIEVRL